jgi:hypothetical protein
MFDVLHISSRNTALIVVAAAIVAGAVAMPTAARAETLPASGATAGGSVEIPHGENRTIIVDETAAGVGVLTTEKVGGGTWIYGTGGGNSYSYYDHGGKTHSSTACAGYGTSCKSSGWVSKGQRSVAQVLKTGWGNTAFWNTK